LEGLEARKLLSRAHLAIAHPRAAAVVAVPVSLSGTLAVDNNAVSSTQNSDGSSTTSVPVAGQLGTLGVVHGLWNETADSFGDVQGLDALRLNTSQGGLIVVFNNQTSGPPHRMGHGTVFYEHPQRILEGTGSLAHASESGSIEVVTNGAKRIVESLILKST
jgi:hypothetical protein